MVVYDEVGDPVHRESNIVIISYMTQNEHNLK